MSRSAFVLVDDEKTILNSLKCELRREFGLDYLYEIAEDVDEAWEVIEDLQEDGVELFVVVSDWLMPGVRGDAFLAEVRDRFPGSIRIMLTGQADAAAIHRARHSAKVNDVVAKPWEIADLVQIIAGAGR